MPLYSTSRQSKSCDTSTQQRNPVNNLPVPFRRHFGTHSKEQLILACLQAFLHVESESERTIFSGTASASKCEDQDANYWRCWNVEESKWKGIVETGLCYWRRDPNVGRVVLWQTDIGKRNYTCKVVHCSLTRLLNIFISTIVPFSLSIYDLPRSDWMMCSATTGNNVFNAEINLTMDKSCIEFS